MAQGKTISVGFKKLQLRKPETQLASDKEVLFTFSIILRFLFCSLLLRFRGLLFFLFKKKSNQPGGNETFLLINL